MHYRRRRRRMFAVLVAVVAVLIGGLSDPAGADPPGGSTQCAFAAGGLIGDKWRSLGGPSGPLGCPAGAERDVPGRTGRAQAFHQGEIVWSPDQGGALVVAAYQWQRTIVVDWGPTTPFNYDFFIVRWDRDGANIGQQDVTGGPRERGRFSFRPPADGAYDVIVEGCDGGPFSSTCRQQWTIPARVVFGTPPPPTNTCPIAAGGLIGQRWLDLGGQPGPLGCPTGSERDAPGRAGRVQTFAHGEVAWSPDQGPQTVVAAYQDADNVVVNWGDTAPFNYDRFVVNWDRDGADPGRADVAQYIDRTYGFFRLAHPVPGRYTVTVLGCDDPPDRPGCRQGTTVPVAVQYDLPIAAGSCATAPGGLIGQKWADLGGSEGPLGCPTGDEWAVPGRNGRVTDFEHGQIVYSPDQGSALTVAFYQESGQLVADWGPTGPFSYDTFVVRLSRPQAGTVQQDVGSGTAGRWTAPVGRAGAYTFVVEGCDTRFLRSSVCRQGFTVPVTVQADVAPAAPAPSEDCPLRPAEPLLGRWRATGAKDGPLGCPTGPESPAPNGRVMTFTNGQIVASFAQGRAMTVAVYQRGEALVADWGDTAPFRYDYFIVQLRREGVLVGQADVRDGPATGGSYSFWPQRPGDSQNPLVDSTGYYSVTVEGCDTRFGRSSVCRQGWTIPASAPYVTVGAFDISSLPAPTTVADAYGGVKARSLAAARYLACPGRMPATTLENEDGFPMIAIAKLYTAQAGVFSDEGPARCTGNRLSAAVEVNDALRGATITSNAGTTTGFPCKRQGEYDVVLKGYITIAYEYWGLLAPDVRYRIQRLLNKRGPHDSGDDSYCGLLAIGETENHRLNTESARYLTNQLLYASDPNPLYDNAYNGMTAFILGRLQDLVRNDFIEYNARPYERYSLQSIQNLYDYAIDPRVRTGAQIVLDYVSAKYAVSTSDSRRDSPYRRLVEDYHPDLFHRQSDALKDRMMALFGPPSVLRELRPANFMPAGAASELLLAGISGYRPPDAVADLVLNPAHRTFYQRLNHAGAEVYASTPDYLITAGGIFTGPAYTVLGQGKDNDTGNVVATSLMPTGHLISTDQMVHFAAGGFDDTCVAPGFACGGRVLVPAAYTPADRPQCWIADGQWTFIDQATPECNTATDKSHGFYVAVRQQRDADEVGFFEAVPLADLTGVTLEDFRRRTLAHNAGRSFRVAVGNAALRYTTLAGTDIRFTAGDASYKILSTGDPAVDGVPWTPQDGPLANGTIINSEGHSGRLTIDNPALNRRLTLDFTVTGDPRRTEGTIH